MDHRGQYMSGDVPLPGHLPSARQHYPQPYSPSSCPVYPPLQREPWDQNNHYQRGIARFSRGRAEILSVHNLGVQMDYRLPQMAQNVRRATIQRVEEPHEPHRCDRLYSVDLSDEKKTNRTDISTRGRTV